MRILLKTGNPEHTVQKKYKYLFEGDKSKNMPVNQAGGIVSGLQEFRVSIHIL